MQRLQRAIPLPASEQLIEHTMEAMNLTRRRAIALMQSETAKADLWRNDVYQVQRHYDGRFVHLNIRRIDGEAILRDWREFQAIKNQLVGEECEAVELYPAESRKIDSSNKYHLFAAPDPTFRFPLGWDKRDVQDVDDRDQPGMKQRRLDVPCPTDHDAMLAIQQLLDGAEWSADTLGEIATILTEAGYPIRDEVEGG
jgi:hypothetical protein